MNVNEPVRAAALARLDVLIGTWELRAVFPSEPAAVLRGGRSVFEWMKGGQLLIQRTAAPTPAAPDSLAIIAFDGVGHGYTQHYFDARGVVRLYAMTSRDAVWTLVRKSPDFSPLDFLQRYRGVFRDNDPVIRGAWERSTDGSTWEKDFDLSYVRVE